MKKKNNPFEDIVSDPDYTGHSDVELGIWYVRKAHSAFERDIEFSLSFAEYKKLMTKKTCFYTGYPFSAHSERNDRVATLDRINPDLGYTVDNTVVCLKVVNAIKNTLFESGEYKVEIALVEKLVSKLIEVDFSPREFPVPASNASLEKLVNKE